MYPLMGFYTEKERRDILSILLNHLQESTNRPIHGDMAFTEENWNALYRGEYYMEHTSGVMMFSIPEITGVIPIKVKLSDVVTWIVADRSGHSVKLPITVYETIYDIPLSLTTGKKLVLREASGDALIDSITTIFK